MITLLGNLQLGLSRLFGLLLWPFQWVHPLWTLLGTSLLTCLLGLWLFGSWSDQAGLRKARRRIQGRLLGLHLFRRDLRTVMRLQYDITRDLLTCLRIALVPLSLMGVGLLLVLTQLAPYLSVRPLRIGEAATVTVRLASGIEDWEACRLEAPGEIRVEDRVLIPRLREISWKIRAEAPVRGFLAFTLGEEVVRKEVRAGDPTGPAFRLRGSRALEILLHPGEPPMAPSGAIRTIRVKYPPRQAVPPGLGMSWPWIFLISSILFTLALRVLLRVEI